MLVTFKDGPAAVFPIKEFHFLLAWNLEFVSETEQVAGDAGYKQIMIWELTCLS